jgi:hypothetical protein
MWPGNLVIRQAFRVSRERETRAPISMLAFI